MRRVIEAAGWVVPVILGSALVGVVVWRGPAPMGDEIFQLLIMWASLSILACAAAAVSPHTGRNPVAFSLLYLVGHVLLWSQIARRDGYAVFSLQLFLAVVPTAILAGVAYLANATSLYLWHRFDK